MRGLVRPGAADTSTAALRAWGAEPVPVEPTDVDALAAALVGSDVVVSALNGLAPVIVDRQLVLLEAAARAGVPRFLSSDYSADFTKASPGGNRNFDLRRQFMARAAETPVALTSVMNGAFMDMLDGVMPIIQPRIHRVLHWGDPDQVLDLTTKDDTAAWTAAVALDPASPRVVRVAGSSVSSREIAETLSEVRGVEYRLLRVGSPASLGVLVGISRVVAPQRREVFPAWQGMQYMRDMSLGHVRLQPLDNHRYPDVEPTALRDYLSGLLAAKP